MTKKIKIHIADDHKVLIDGMKTLIQTNPHYIVSGYSINGIDLLQKVIDEKADILIIDINMPEKDGIEVLKEYAVMEEQNFDVIVLSSYDELKLIKEVMKLGAKGYLTKQCAGENILEAIQVVSDGEEYFCETVRNKIFNAFVQKNPNASTSNEHLEDKRITDREVEILKLLALEYSSKEISQELFISTNTVETHKKRLLKKLNAKTTIGLVKYAIKHNLIIN